MTKQPFLTQQGDTAESKGKPSANNYSPVCARTACASLPVLVAHGENLLHAVVHGFGEAAELLALLIAAQPHTHAHS